MKSSTAPPSSFTMRSRNSATSRRHVAEPLPTAAASTLRAYHRPPRERLAPPAPRCSAPTPQRLARGLDELRSQVGTGRPHDGVELGVDAKAPEDCRLHQQRRLSFRHAAPLDRRGRTSRPTSGGSSTLPCPKRYPLTSVIGFAERTHDPGRPRPSRPQAAPARRASHALKEGPTATVGSTLDLSSRDPP